MEFEFVKKKMKKKKKKPAKPLLPFFAWSGNRPGLRSASSSDEDSQGSNGEALAATFEKMTKYSHGHWKQQQRIPSRRLIFFSTQFDGPGIKFNSEPDTRSP